MNAAVANPVIEKQCFRNDSPGWLGYVAIGPKGEDRGRSVAPGELIWLSEAEQIMTANAPRHAHNNPFIEQEMHFGVDEEGKPITRIVTPLTAVTENRYVPAGDRPIPAQGMQEMPAAPADAVPPVEPPADPAVNSAPQPEENPDVNEGAVRAREQAVLDARDAGQTLGPVPVPPRAAAAVEAANAAKLESQPTPPVADEVAAHTVPEEQIETGAAVPPVQDAPEGEYAAQEEVGTPEAAAAAPAPYVPEEG